MLTKRQRQVPKLTEITNYANVLIVQEVFDDVQVQVNVITMIIILCKTSINITLKSTKI